MKNQPWKKKSLIDLLELPRQLKNRAIVSFYELLKETGYFQVHRQITGERIYAALKDNPEYIADWIAYSEDKRASTGWYIERRENNSHIVGYYSGKTGRQSETRHADLIAACAVFIKHEIEDIRAITMGQSRHG